MRVHAGATEIELATLEYVDWYNHRRPHSGAADLPRALFEALYDPNNARLEPARPATIFATVDCCSTSPMIPTQPRIAPRRELPRAHRAHVQALSCQ
jgi:hypothetical protein